jgi:uncharacterized protein YfaT (DUF1175 family)
MGTEGILADIDGIAKRTPIRHGHHSGYLDIALQLDHILQSMRTVWVSQDKRRNDIGLRWEYENGCSGLVPAA